MLNCQTELSRYIFILIFIYYSLGHHLLNMSHTKKPSGAWFEKKRKKERKTTSNHP